MIADVDVLTAIARQRRPIQGVLGVAMALAVDRDDELAAQLARLVQEGKLDRWQVADSTGFLYGLTTRGRQYLAAEGVDVSKLPPPIKRCNPNPQTADNPGASPGARASCTEAPEGNRAISNAASGASATRETARPNRLGREEGQPPSRRIHRAAVAEPNEEQEEVVKPEEHMDSLERIVKKLNAWYPLKELAKLSGLKPHVARAALRLLVESGRIQARGATSSKMYGAIGLAADSAPGTRSKLPKPRTAKKVKATKRRASRVAKATLAREGLSAFPVASFTARGEIHVHGGAGSKILDANESAAIVDLVRAFDKAGLLSAPQT